MNKNKFVFCSYDIDGIKLFGNDDSLLGSGSGERYSISLHEHRDSELHST